MAEEINELLVGEFLEASQKYNNVENVRAMVESVPGLVNCRGDAAGWSSVTPLWLAAYYDRVDALKFLISQGAELDALCEDNQGTALMAAAQNGLINVVNELLAAGADRSIVDGEGETAASIALRNEYQEIADLLAV